MVFTRSSLKWTGEINLKDLGKSFTRDVLVMQMATLQRRKERAAGASCLWIRGREVVRWESEPLGLSGSPVCRQTVQHPV